MVDMCNTMFLQMIFSGANLDIGGIQKVRSLKFADF